MTLFPFNKRINYISVQHFYLTNYLPLPFCIAVSI